MDIAKYAGLFFVKSEYIYLPGIGNIEVKKQPSSYSTEYGQEEQGEKEIIFKKVTGVIDDAFANFVANNERISIAAATNGIRDFGAKVKKEIAKGNTVEIPGVGKFVNNNSEIDFVADGNIEFQPKKIPIFENSEALKSPREKNIKEIIDETTFVQPKSDDEIVIDKPKVNYGKVVTVAILGLAVLGGLAYLVYYLMNQNSIDTTENTDPVVEEATAPVDSLKTNDSTTTAVATNPNEYKIIVNQYNNTAKAESRSKKLISYGHNAEVVAQDSANVFVIIKLPSTTGPEAQVVDSIRRLLNPRFDVRILK